MDAAFTIILRAMVALTAALVFASAARADLFVVVNASNAAKSLTHKEVVDLFMGRTRAFAGGEFAHALDLPKDSAARAAFYTALTGMTSAQVNSYWSRLMFSGQTMPPQQVAGEAAMQEAVRRTPGAIGYLSQEPSDRSLRVVLVLKETAK
jgi:ABC-type phosphate transport system substrate-binding protein